MFGSFRCDIHARFRVSYIKKWFKLLFSPKIGTKKLTQRTSVYRHLQPKMLATGVTSSNKTIHNLKLSIQYFQGLSLKKIQTRQYVFRKCIFARHHSFNLYVATITFIFEPSGNGSILAKPFLFVLDLSYHKTSD
jgi:hypothetical protein